MKCIGLKNLFSTYANRKLIIDTNMNIITKDKIVGKRFKTPEKTFVKIVPIIE